jgi:transcriptional regulator GlxA family with amidase domain
MDDRPVSRLDFTMKVATDGPSQLWRSYAQMLASAACTGDGAVDVPSMALMEEMLITFLLHSQPHTFSEHLQRLPRHVAPRQVKRAIAYIEDNLDEAITLEKLAEIAGCSMRSLHRSFKATHDVSPMRYLRDARLKRVRHRLSDVANEHKTIAEVAASCGFWHMGAFAAHYRGEFGEAPHETRRIHRG